MSNKKYKEWLKEMEDVSKDDILKFYYNLYFKYEKQQEVLDKIKELINHYAVEDEDYSKLYNQEEQDILELLEVIK